MSPSPLSLAATVTYHRIILISCGKTAGRSCRSSRTFVYFAVYVRFSVASGKKEPVTPTSGGVTGVGWPISTLLDRLHPLLGLVQRCGGGDGRFPGSRGRTTHPPRAKSE